MKEERYKLFLILKGAALTIEDWYINRLEKMGKKFRYNHSLEEVLNDDFVENEVVQPKSHKKIKIAIAITASLELLLLLFY